MPRKDLNKVLCERERRGAGTPKGRKKMDAIKHGVTTWPFKGESTSPFPHKEGMQTHYVNYRKTFSENLNPLWGFLHKSVGKKWDKVYSELCVVFDKRKVINQHILLHLDMNVEQKTFMAGGKVYFTDTRDWNATDRTKLIEESGADYYVHPVSKILLLNKVSAARLQKEKEAALEHKKKMAQHLRLLGRFNNQNGDGARYAINIKDVWYEISVVKTPEPSKYRRTNSKGDIEYVTHFPSVDAVSIRGAKVFPVELTNTPGFYVCRKEQLNKKRLKDLGLK